MKQSTYFVDIDGTLIKYRKFENMLFEQAVAITPTCNHINTRYEEGCHIVVTTARPEELREFTIKELDKIGLKYHQLVMGIERGTRYLINDMEEVGVERAVAINVRRDFGM